MTINTTDFSTRAQSTDGEGIFDVLMALATIHLKGEFEANRIRGNDYATVYTSIIGQAMATAASYALQKPSAEQEVLNSQASLAGIEAQTAAIIAKTGPEVEILQKQSTNIDAQIDNLIAEKSQIEATTENLVAEKANILLKDNISTEQIALLRDQQDKVEAETALLEQKKVTEDAQTNPVASGVIGEQLKLYAAQAKGYDVDQKVKVAKLHTDIAAVQLNINEEYGALIDGAGLANADIAQAVRAARNSV